MPIEVDTEITKLAQDSFAQIAYDVVNEAFIIYNEMGSHFSEKVYQKALTSRLANLQSEVRIDIVFQKFIKSYYIDIVASNGAIIELKSHNHIEASHRQQLLNYLLLTGTLHGKIINFSPDRIEHEFVNTTLSFKDRSSFSVDQTEWKATHGFSENLKLLISQMIRDWGTSLSRSLYEEAIVFHLGGAESAYKNIDVLLDRKTLFPQKIIVCSEDTAIKITTFEKNLSRHHKDLNKFLSCLNLKALQWINIARNRITFTTITK